MSSTNEARWKQRLSNFGKALSRLDEACSKDSYTDLELAGLVQTFVFCYELGWKVLKDLLFYGGFDLKIPREIIRKGFEAGYLSENDAEIFLDAVSNRHTLGHVYKEEVAQKAETLVRNNYHPMLTRLYGTLEQRRTR